MTLPELSVQQIAEALWGTPEAAALATRPERDCGLPSKPGFYAWWAEAGALPGVPDEPHPSDRSLSLVYVGISPVRASSSGTIRSRVVGHHLGGNTGSSTFRFVLASLLLDVLALHCRVTPSQKYVLEHIDNKRLRDWQLAHCSLTWVARPRPWEVEDGVIDVMKPPLNCAQNESHPFYGTVKAARERFRQVARAATPS